MSSIKLFRQTRCFCVRESLLAAFVSRIISHPGEQPTRRAVLSCEESLKRKFRSRKGKTTKEKPMVCACECRMQTDVLESTYVWRNTRGAEDWEWPTARFRGKGKRRAGKHWPPRKLDESWVVTSNCTRKHGKLSRPVHRSPPEAELHMVKKSEGCVLFSFPSLFFSFNVDEFASSFGWLWSGKSECKSVPLCSVSSAKPQLKIHNAESWSLSKVSWIYNPDVVFAKLEETWI